MAKITIDARFLAHEGGTKFYEVIGFNSNARGRYVVVRRWGKIAARYGGGETKVEAFGNAAGRTRDANDLVLSKLKRGYELETASHGLHSKKVIEESELREALRHHYTDSDTREHILMQLNAEGSDAPKFEEPEDDIVEEAPAPEPERSGDWGSW